MATGDLGMRHAPASFADQRGAAEEVEELNVTALAAREQRVGLTPVLDGLTGGAASVQAVDVSEVSLAERASGLLPELLKDHASGRGIIWATHHYADLGDAYAPDQEITVESITGKYRLIIQPRVEKSKIQQWNRTKGRAEVFTPSWLCNEQNNRIDEAWFGRTDVFNTTIGRTWEPTSEPVQFEAHGRRTWRKYVDERRLEVACGEGPYLVSRYDTVTGRLIPLAARIGILDRKLRVVGENTEGPDEWRAWARRAVESVYGFEFQGDSLLLARENILATYQDYAGSALGEAPSGSQLKSIATVISWNIWQMDLMTGQPPLRAAYSNAKQLELFDDRSDCEVRGCLLRDWRAKRTYAYRELLQEGKGVS